MLDPRSYAALLKRLGRPGADNTVAAREGSNPLKLVDMTALKAMLGPVTPSAHASTHKGTGSDAIDNATAFISGLMSFDDFNKLAAIEALADVTDAPNVKLAGAVMESDYNAVQTLLMRLAGAGPVPVAAANDTFFSRNGSADTAFNTVGTARSMLDVQYLLEAPKTTTVEIVDDSTEADLFTATIPANLLGTDRFVEFHVHGDYLNDSGVTSRLRFVAKYGATVMMSSQTNNIATDTGRRAWNGCIRLMADGATDAQRMWASALLSGKDEAIQGYGHFANMHNDSNKGKLFLIGGTATEDSTGDLTFAFRAKHTVANASISVRFFGAYLMAMAA